MVFANLERFGNGREVVAAAQTRGAQILSHGFKRGVAVARNLAQMDAAAFDIAAVVQRQACYFGHRATNIRCSARLPAKSSIPSGNPDVSAPASNQPGTM